MRAHLSNAAFGVLDYAAYPVGMLLVAPIMLRNLGIAQYGIWAVATAAVNTGSIIASGFGDANIQHVATGRTTGDLGLYGSHGAQHDGNPFGSWLSNGHRGLDNRTVPRKPRGCHQCRPSNKLFVVPSHCRTDYVRPCC